MNIQQKGEKIMAVKIRLTRLGDKKSPFYRIVVADSRKARDGQYIDQIGTFNPLTTPEEIKVDVAKANKWLANGAQPTDTAKALLIKANIKMPEKKAKKDKKEVAKEEPTQEKTTKKTTTVKKTATKATTETKKTATKSATAKTTKKAKAE